MTGSTGFRESCSTAGREYENALISLREAEDADWNGDVSAPNRVIFWREQVRRYQSMPANTVVPMF